MFEIEENTLDELPYSITCLQFAYLAYEVAPENVNSMRHLEPKARWRVTVIL